MNCSTCEFAAMIKDAEHSGVRFEDTPCATCELTEDSSHTLEFDEGRSEIGYQSNDEGDDPELPLSVLAEALRGFMELPPRTFRIVQRRYKGDSYALIAEELKVTPQAVEIQLRRALEAHPHLKQLLPEKAKRQAARKRRQRSMARRGKPGSV